MLVFRMALISYLHVVVVLAYLFVLLLFARLGFCNRVWNNIVPGGWLLCLPNRHGSVEWLLNRLVTRHFLPFLKFICSSGIVGSVVHAYFLHGTNFLFACCCCSCLPIRVVAVFMFGFLQSRLEQHHSWGVVAPCFFLRCMLFIVG
jgi:hypothetical protein